MKHKLMKNKVDADELWKVAWTYIRTVVDTLREPFLILDEDLKVVSANKTFYSFFQVTQDSIEGKIVYSLGNGQWNIPKLRILLEDILPGNSYFEDFKVEHLFPKIGFKIIMLNARRVFGVDEETPIILLAMEDVTKQKQLEEKLKQFTRELSMEVARRTTELEIRVKELEKMNEVMIGRELKMIELKNELKQFKKSRKR